MAVMLHMRNGDVWTLNGAYSVQEVTDLLADARKKDALATFERDRIPRGQKLTVEPRAVETVEAEPW